MVRVRLLHTRKIIMNKPLNEMSWSELQEWAKRSDWTNPPAKRKQVSAREEPKLSDDQKVAITAHPFTIDAMAAKFAWQNRNKLRYVPQRSKWLYWDGHVWKWDETGYAAELVKEFGRSYLYEKSGGEEKQKLNAKAHRDLTSPKGIKDILTLVSTDPLMVAGIEEFDASIYDLNTPAGIVDLYTGELTAPTPESLVKRSTTVAPDASCPTPRYDNLMADAFMGNPELSDYVETMMGISLIKAQDEQVFMYMYGAAGSGKGTLMNIAQDLLGKGESGYTVYVDSSMFVQSRNSPHPTEMMQFLGARMAISSEVSQGQKMDTGKLKKITGGDRITGRYMQKDYVTYDATHTLWIMANDRLQVPHDDKGVWRRLRVVDFKFPKKEGEYIGGLDKLIVSEEGPGVLARWIAKAKQYLNEGYQTPQSVKDAGKEYVEEQDNVQQWLDFRAATDNPSCFTSSEALRDSYMDYCKREKLTPLGPYKFGDALEAKGFARDRSRLRPTDKSVTRGHRGIYLAENVTVPF